jgi:hypothetical protein
VETTQAIVVRRVSELEDRLDEAIQGLSATMREEVGRIDGVVVPLLTETLSLTLAERDERVKADADLSAEWNKALNTALNTERGEWTAAAVKEKEDRIALIGALRQAHAYHMHT